MGKTGGSARIATPKCLIVREVLVLSVFADLPRLMIWWQACEQSPTKCGCAEVPFFQRRILEIEQDVWSWGFTGKPDGFMMLIIELKAKCLFLLHDVA